MSPSLRFGARSDVGLLRELNEDSLYAGPRLLAVADGMGGHAAGEVASRVAIQAVAPLDDDQPGADLISNLRDAVESASESLQRMVAADSALDGMGTTLTALLFAGRRLGLVHIGDSRCYLLRDGLLTQITHDHTLVQHLVDEGRITAEEATTHPQRSWITRSLTGRGELELDLSIREARPGDRYLLCSDGLSGPVSEEMIAETLRTADTPQRACDALVDLALRAGGPDNVSAIVADVLDDDVAADERPIVGGAADGISSMQATTADTGEDAEEATTVKGGPTRRLLLVLSAVVVVIAAVVVGTYLYARTQYYVAVAHGSPDTVAVYRGIHGHVLVDLSRLQQRTDLPLTALPAYEQPVVTSGIDAKSRADAERIVANLRALACPTPTPTPTATPTPTPKPTASPKAVPAPVPTPTPSYCASGP